MKKLALTLAILGLIGLGGQATAELCTIDAVPAATLLLPYFEVDLDNPVGLNTVFSINNASAAPVVVHVTLWTDLSVPSIDFDVALTGYDVVPISLRDVFVNGNVPETETVDDADAISPFGPFSFGAGAFPNCGSLPYTNPVLKGGGLDAHARALHTGQFSNVYGACGGVDYGDNIARGYVTMDVVQDCNTFFPSDALYYGAGGIAVGTDANLIWGDYYIVDNINNFADGDNLVHIESGPDDPAFFHPGDYTFYGRYVNGLATDQREPLGTTYAARLIQGGGFSGGSSYLVWRDAKLKVNPFACGTLPNPFPLAHQQIVAFDEEENPGECEVFNPISPLTGECPCIFCWEAQRTTLADLEADLLPLPDGSGWLYMNLNTTTGGVFDPNAQAWVTAIFSAEGRYSVGLPAIQLDSACSPNDLILPVD